MRRDDRVHVRGRLLRGTLSTKRRFALPGATVRVVRREEPMGSVLFVDKGKIDFLEMFAYSEPWPDDTSAFSIEHDGEQRDRKELEGVEL